MNAKIIEMKWNIFCFSTFFLCLFVSNTDSHFTPDSPDYEAVVVEYAADGNPAKDSPLQVISRNWEAYSQYIKDAEGADIIVFPECGLTTAALPTRREELRPFLSRVPDPDATASGTPLCDAAAAAPPPAAGHSPSLLQQLQDGGGGGGGASEVLRNASCAARRHAIYVVLNLPEESPCEGLGLCPPDGIFIYNTNVVFDRNGSLVARYRKYHLFVEPGFDAPPRAELAVFETDFGVRFATFICFDVLFEAPALRLVREQRVTDVAYPTAWFSQLPFLTAVETQAGWAHAANVTLLAAGLNRPEQSNTGSAILWGDGGALRGTMRKQRGSVALRARVPKRQQQQPPPPPSPTNDPPLPQTPSAAAAAASAHGTRLTLQPTPITVSQLGHLKLWQDDLRAWATVLLPPAGGDFNATLCHGETLCCRVELQAQNAVATNASAAAVPKHYFYRAGAFDGMHNYAGTLAAGVQACGVFACLDESSLSSCGLSEEGRVAGLAFRRLTLTVDGFQRQRALQMPSTVQAESLLPLPASSFHFEVQPAPSQSASNRVVVATTRPLHGSLLALGVYGRVFDRDRPVRDALPTAAVAAADAATGVNLPLAASRDKTEL